jgi:hypothetical protein
MLISLNKLIQVGTVRRAIEKGKNNSAMAKTSGSNGHKQN